MSIVVPGDGNPRARWMLVGEAPGEDEAHSGRPFTGKTGRELNGHLERNGLDRDTGWLTNLNKEYRPGNPAPTEEDITRWGPELLKEIRQIKPTYIVTAGAAATHFFIKDAHLDAVHGVPQKSTIPEVSAIILPTYHPAAHFYAPDLLQFIVYDFAQAAGVIRGKISDRPASDDYPNPEYVDGGPDEIPEFIGGSEFIGFDTEGVPGDVWSFQVSCCPGTALVVRQSHPKFRRALSAFARACRNRTIVFHNGMYELEMFASLGIDLLDVDLNISFFDTMMAAFIQVIEPQALKNLSRRHLGMVMKSYHDTVGDIGKQKQMDYLHRVFEIEWPKSEPRVEFENDGSAHMYTPKNIGKIAEAIVLDVYSGKINKDGPTDPMKRWKKADSVQRKMVEKVLGPMPVGTLADIPLDEAIYYSGRDPDATLRLHSKMVGALASSKQTELMAMKMTMFPVAAAMKLNGMLGERASFQALSERMWERMDSIRGKISKNYFGGKVINPGSGDQIATLMRRHGIVGEKKTPTGKMSTSKKSIEHLRFTEPVIDAVEEWREHQKIRDSFAEPVLERWPDDNPDFCRITGDLKITRVTSGRFSMTAYDDRPSAPLLAIPVRTNLGKEVRHCYVAEPGYVLGSWDLDQAEMRLMADESRDPVLCKLFNDGKIDVHGSTASKIFGVPYAETMTGAGKMLYRYPAKRAGFGVITGIQAQGLWDQLRMAGCTGWNLRSVGKLIVDWFKIYEGVKAYMEACKEECRRNGGVIRDRWGMPRYLPGVFSDDKWTRWEAERMTHSHKIQGGAQGMLQRSMAWMRPRLAAFGGAVRPILQIHDEIILEVADGLQEEVDAIMVEALTKHGAHLRVPVKSSGSFALRWDKLKD